jgi:hypothetical protein
MSDTTAVSAISDPAARAVYQGLIRPVPGTALTAPTEGAVNSLSFVAVVLVNGKEVPIKSGDLLNLKEGIEFTLPPETSLQLGNLEALVNWFAAQMGFEPVDWSTLPTALQEIMKVEASIETLMIKASKAALEFDIAVMLTFNWTIIGDLKLQTFTFRLTRKQAEA